MLIYVHSCVHVYETDKAWLLLEGICYCEICLDSGSWHDMYILQWSILIIVYFLLGRKVMMICRRLFLCATNTSRARASQDPKSLAKLRSCRKVCELVGWDGAGQCGAGQGGRQADIKYWDSQNDYFWRVGCLLGGVGRVIPECRTGTDPGFCVRVCVCGGRQPN